MKNEAPGCSSIVIRHLSSLLQRRSVMDAGIIAIGAALAVGLAAIATATAQARIGAAGVGAMAEKPELLGSVILLVAIPETMVILGFAVAAMILLLEG
jgi:V/A-type H+-transporting ATPase subunit K